VKTDDRCQSINSIQRTALTIQQIPREKRSVKTTIIIKSQDYIPYITLPIPTYTQVRKHLHHHSWPL